MEDSDTEKYHVSSLIQDFVFSSRKMGCSMCISSQVYNKSCLKQAYKWAIGWCTLSCSFQRNGYVIFGPLAGYNMLHLT